MKIRINQDIELNKDSWHALLEMPWEWGIEVELAPTLGQKGVATLAIRENGSTRIRIEGIPLSYIKISPSLLMGAEK